MGKKKLAVIDDSQSVEEVKVEPKKKVNPNPELLEKVEVKKKVNPNPESVIPSEVEGSLEDKKADSGQGGMTNKGESKKTTTPKQGKKIRSKKFIEAQEKVERTKNYAINDAVDLAKETSYSKFDGTLEIHINTSVKGIRGLINLPFASGKKLTILAFGKGAEESGADLVGDDNALTEIMKGKVNFDVLVTTPDWMAKLARAAKTLGPKGLMPNPKNGTISTDLKKTVAELQGGKTEYKTESKANVIHLGLGKISQPTDELSQNIKLLLTTIGKTKIKKATISPTMGPAVRLDVSSI